MENGKVRLNLRLRVKCSDKAFAQFLGDHIQANLENMLTDVVSVKGFEIEADLEPL